jgi:hypothetical protein
MALLKTHPTKPEPLEDRVNRLRDELDAAIDALAQAEVERMGGGVPVDSIRTSITGGASCLCQAYQLAKAGGA